MAGGSGRKSSAASRSLSLSLWSCSPAPPLLYTTTCLLPSFLLPVDLVVKLRLAAILCTYLRSCVEREAGKGSEVALGESWNVLSCCQMCCWVRPSMLTSLRPERWGAALARPCCVGGAAAGWEEAGGRGRRWRRRGAA